MSRLVFATIFWLVALPVAAADLIMVQQPGCAWCARWDAEIAEIYPRTPEGRAASLRRIDLAALPADLALARKVHFTPTFLLIENGAELARIEGYPGEDFFWGLLGMMLQANTQFKGAS